MEDDNLENSLTEMDWLLQLNGFASEEADDQRNQELGNGVADFGRIRASDSSYPGVHNYRSKPPFSYTHLITEAISSTEYKRMSLSEIYQWIRQYYPYYRTAAPGWKVLAVYSKKTKKNHLTLTFIVIPVLRFRTRGSGRIRTLFFF